VAGHTPFPWRPGRQIDSIIGAGEARTPAEQIHYGGRVVAESVDWSDRETILRMADSFDGLLAACKDALALLERDLADCPFAEPERQALRAAIAKAEGRPA
jgi:hypothetical protein